MVHAYIRTSIDVWEFVLKHSLCCFCEHMQCCIHKNQDLQGKVIDTLLPSTEEGLCVCVCVCVCVRVWV